MNILELKNIYLSFGNQLIFDDAFLAISKPGFYCLVGRNGTGKTTLFNIFTNRVKINSGEMISNRDQISYCDANSLLFLNLSVRENLMLVADDEKRIEELSNKFQVEKLLDAQPKRLSEGERQRIAIIRTILEDKQVMLLDEVTSHIDDKNARIVLNYLKELSKTRIIIYATHFKKEVNVYADSVIKIENHKITINNVNEENRVLDSANDKNYNSFKILNKIIRFKPDYIFAILFIILISFTLSSIWLSSITKVDAFQNVETKALNSNYSIIDDYSMNLYDPYFTGYSSGTDVNDRVEEFINRNPKYKLGIKNYCLNSGKEPGNNILIQHFLFDNNLENYEILCNKYTYNWLVEESLAKNYILTFRHDTFRIKLTDGDYEFTLLVTNEYTYKVLAKFNFNFNVSTMADTSVHLISGRMPENDDEILRRSDVWGEEDSITLGFADVNKTYNIVGVFDTVLESIYEESPWFIAYDDHAFDFKLEATDVLHGETRYIAYGDTNDLTKDDINFILSNELYIVNDVEKYAYEAYIFFGNTRDSFIRMLIFVLTLDTITIFYYISYWSHSNKDRYDELKRLNKIKLIKKRFIIKRIILGLSIFIFGISIYLIAQRFADKAFIKNCFTDSVSKYGFTFIKNKFMLYAIPFLILFESVVSVIQVRRNLYD